MYAVLSEHPGQPSCPASLALNMSLDFECPRITDKGERGHKLTEAIKHVEHRNQRHSGEIHGIAPFSKTERALGEMPPFCQDICQERNGVRHGGENDERPRQIEEGSRATKRDGAQPRGNDGHKESRGHRTRQTLLDAGKQAREGHSIVAGKSPVDA